MAIKEKISFQPEYHDLVRKDAFQLIPFGLENLLDFGGGIGATAVELKRLGYARRVGVIDGLSAEGQLAELDFRYSGNLETTAIVKAMIDKEGPFDTILCLDVLEHLRDPWSTVRLLHSALKPNGCIVASIPNVRNYAATFPLIFKNEWTLRDSGILDRTHLRFFVRDSAIELMRSSGLTLDAITPLPSGGRKIALVRTLTLGLFNSFTDRQYLLRLKLA